jgi:glycosyltransferase involved in cell wall biosynthesis
MRVLICSNAYPPYFTGGAELMAHEQAKALVRLGYEVNVFAGSLGEYTGRYARTTGSHEGIIVHRIGLVPEDYSPEYLNFLHPAVDAHFMDVIREFTPDVVHCHNLSGLSVKLPMLARRQGAATICTLHDFWGFCLRNTAMRADGTPCGDFTQCRACVERIHDGRKLHVAMRFRKDFMRLALNQVERFIAPSRFVARCYADSGFDPARIEVVANGVDINQFHPRAAPPPGDVLRVAYVGYLGPHKGIDTLLEAFALLVTQCPKATLHLIGEGPGRPAYETRSEELGVADRVHFLGRIEPSQMPQVYSKSDIVVLPSIWDENQPVCLMEAMATGIPVVASRKGGIPELIDDGVNGLLFAAGDAGDLVRQLSALARNPALRQSLGAAARERIASSGHEEQARQLAAIYRAVLQAPPPKAEDRALFAAVGSLKRKMRDEAAVLDDSRFPSRAFVPSPWLSDLAPSFDGWLLTGIPWSACQWLRVDAMLSLPWMRRRPARGPVRRRGEGRAGGQTR